MTRFFPEAAGPHDPVRVTPPRSKGSVRRTSTIDTGRPEGLDAGVVVEARARDLRTNADGSSEVVGQATLQAALSPTYELMSIASSPACAALARLVGVTVGPGFRGRALGAVAGDIHEGSLLYSLLDDLPVSTMVSGYARHHARAADAAAEQATEQPHRGPRIDVSWRSDVCAGWASDATLLTQLRDAGSVPASQGPPAPSLESPDDPLAWHATAALAPHAMRRRRRLDLIAPHNPDNPDNPDTDGSVWRIDLHFRDSHVRADGNEYVLHEYTVQGTADPAAGRIETVSARAQVLPWKECPGAVASAARIGGMELSQLRSRVRQEFTGRTTCTHLNDSLRSLADLTALFGELAPTVS